MRRRAHTEAAAYTHGEPRPLGGYAAAMGTYTAAVAAAGLIGRRRGARLPDGIPWADLALNAIATHKAARLLAKDPVSSPIRAPFTEFEGRSGEAELAESPREGHRHTMGELLTCPFCLGQWVATGFGVGLVMAPRQTRWVMGVFAARAGADLLQFGYDAVQQSVTG